MRETSELDRWTRELIDMEAPIEAHSRMFSVAHGMNVTQASDEIYIRETGNVSVVEN